MTLRMNILRGFFAPDPVKGEWYIEDETDPFKKKHTALVMDIKGGHVLYMRYIDASYAVSQSCEVFDFKLFWKRKEDNDSSHPNE